MKYKDFLISVEEGFNFKNIFKKKDNIEQKIKDIIEGFDRFYNFHNAQKIKNNSHKPSRRSVWNDYIVKLYADLKIDDKLYEKLKSVAL